MIRVGGWPRGELMAGYSSQPRGFKIRLIVKPDTHTQTRVCAHGA